MNECELCAHLVSDEEQGDFCSVYLDEDETERFLTQKTKRCRYFKEYDEYKIVRKQN